MWITRHTLPSSLRSLPAKPPPWQRLVTVADYAPPLSLLIHQLKFPGAVKSPAPCHVCYYWKSYTLVAPPGCNCRIASSAFRYGSGVTGVGDLIRAICCVSRYHAGCTANGIAKPSHVHGPLRPSISQCPAAQAQPENAFRLELPVQGRHMVIVDDVVTTGSTVAEIAQLLYAMVRQLSRSGAFVEPCRASMMGVL